MIFQATAKYNKPHERSQKDLFNDNFFRKLRLKLRPIETLEEILSMKSFEFLENIQGNTSFESF